MRVTTSCEISGVTIKRQPIAHPADDVYFTVEIAAEYAGGAPAGVLALADLTLRDLGTLAAALTTLHEAIRSGNRLEHSVIEVFEPRADWLP